MPQDHKMLAAGDDSSKSDQEIEKHPFLCIDGSNHQFQIAKVDFTFGNVHHPETGNPTYRSTGFVVRKFVCMKCSMIQNFGINLLFMEEK